MVVYVNSCWTFLLLKLLLFSIFFWQRWKCSTLQYKIYIYIFFLFNDFEFRLEIGVLSLLGQKSFHLSAFTWVCYIFSINITYVKTYHVEHVKNAKTSHRNLWIINFYATIGWNVIVKPFKHLIKNETKEQFGVHLPNVMRLEEH